MINSLHTRSISLFTINLAAQTLAPGRIQSHFIEAAGNGDEESIRVLLNEGHRPRSNDALIHAIESARLNSVLALAPFCDLNKASLRGRYPLFVAFTCSTPAFAEALIAAGANLTLRDASGADALIWAAKGPNPALIELALAHCDPLLRDIQGRDALITACLYDRVDNARLLAPVSDLSHSDRGQRAVDIAQNSALKALLLSTELAKTERLELAQLAPISACVARKAAL